MCLENQKREETRAHRAGAWRVRPVRQPAKALAQFRRKEVLRSLSTQLLKDSRKEPPEHKAGSTGSRAAGVAAGGAIAAVRAMARERAVCKLATSTLSSNKEQKLIDDIAKQESLAIFDSDASGTATHWRQVRLSPQPSFGLMDEHSNFLWHQDNNREVSHTNDVSGFGSDEDEDNAISSLELHWQVSTKEVDPALFKDKLLKTFHTFGIATEKLATLVCKLKVPMPGILVADVQGPHNTVSELRKLSLWNVRAKMAKSFGIAILPSSLNEDDEGEEDDMEIPLQPITRVKRGIFQSFIAEPGSWKLPGHDGQVPGTRSSQTVQDMQELRLGAATRIQQKWRKSRRYGIGDAHNRLQREMQRLEDIQEQAQQEFRQEIRKSLAFRQALREGLEELHTTPLPAGKASEPPAQDEEEVAQPAILWTSSENIRELSPGNLRPKPRGSRRSVTIREQGEDKGPPIPASTPHPQEDEKTKFAARVALTRTVVQNLFSTVAQLPKRATSAEVARCIASHVFCKAAETARDYNARVSEEAEQAMECCHSASPYQEAPELDALSAHLMEILSETRKAREALEAACARSQTESQLSAAVEEAWAECYKPKPQPPGASPSAPLAAPGKFGEPEPPAFHADMSCHGGWQPGKPEEAATDYEVSEAAEGEEDLAATLKDYIVEAQEARKALESASSRFLPETELELGLRSLISETRHVRVQMEGACADSRLDALAAAIQDAVSAQEVAVSENLLFRQPTSAPASVIERTQSEDGVWVLQEADGEASCIDTTVIGFFETDSMHLVAAGLEERVQHLWACADSLVH